MFLLLVLVCLLTSLSSAGVVVGGAMSIMFSLLVLLILVGLLSLFLVLCRLFRGLSCGGVILALQSADAVHVGVDNLGVVRLVGRLLHDCSFSAPLERVTDGDLLILLRRMIDLRGSNTVRFTKVKGHADEGMVSDGRVRELDRLGNNAADEAADFGRRTVGPGVIDAGRNLSGVCGRWCPVLLDLHGFFIAISGAVVNHDEFGGTAPDPLVWSAGSLPKRRRIAHAVRNLAMLPGPPALWIGEWVASPAVALNADDVAQWPYTPGLLVKWVSFLGSLHWLVHHGDLGVGGISYVELLSHSV